MKNYIENEEERRKKRRRRGGIFCRKYGTHYIYTELENMMEVDGKKSRICLPHACGCCLSPVVILQSVVFMIYTVSYHAILFTEMHIIFVLFFL